MSGFFKKLFNRVIGRKDEQAPPPAADTPALPAPEPVPPPPIAVEIEPEVVAGAPIETVKVPPKASAPPPPEKKKVAVRKPETKSPEPKQAEAKKPATKTAEPKTPEVKKAEPKKAATPKLDVRPAKARIEESKARAARPEAKAASPKKPGAKAPAPKEPASKIARAAPVVVEAKTPDQTPPPEPPSRVREPEPVIEVEEPVAVATPAPAAEVPEPQPRPASTRTPAAPPAVIEDPAPRKGWLSRLKEGLSKSSKSITGSITAIFTKRKLDKETLQDLEDVLLQADLGLPMAERIIAAVSAGRYDKEVDPEEVKRILATEVAKVLKPVEVPFNFGAEKPFVILVVGVNGAGKTTTIGKLGAIATGEGFKVMFAACDTFRAAAIEQLTVWGQRIGAKTIARPTGSDASGLAFDAMQEARDNGTDILFIDTAGRLQNKQYLMDELDKIVRVIKKQDEAAPHAVLLVLDATTGQNAIAQADIFTKVAGVTGLIMTKLDGTARGGILVAIAEKFKLPVHAIGVGETIDDLQPFEAESFARAIAGLEDA